MDGTGYPIYRLRDWVYRFRMYGFIYIISDQRIENLKAAKFRNRVGRDNTMSVDAVFIHHRSV